jgi:hypothetical protein
MAHIIISNEQLNELFTKLRFSPNAKARKEVKDIIEYELNNDSIYPDEAAKEVVAFLEIDVEFTPTIIEALAPLFLHNSTSTEFNFYPDNI